METKVKAIRTFVNDILDQALAIYKFYEEFETFTKEYLHEHRDEIDNVYVEVKCSNPKFSEIIKGKRENKFLQFL